MQHELLPRVSLDVGYFRTLVRQLRRHRQPRGDARPTSTRSASPRPPIRGCPAAAATVIAASTTSSRTSSARPANNYITLRENYGESDRALERRRRHVNARPRPGMMCRAARAPAAPPPTTATWPRSCRRCCLAPRPWPRRTRTCGCRRPSVTDEVHDPDQADRHLPRSADRRAGRGHVQNLPGPQIVANYTAPNAVVAPSLGPDPLGRCREHRREHRRAGTMYGERINQWICGSARSCGSAASARRPASTLQHAQREPGAHAEQRICHLAAAAEHPRRPVHRTGYEIRFLRHEEHGDQKVTKA